MTTKTMFNRLDELGALYLDDEGKIETEVKTEALVAGIDWKELKAAIVRSSRKIAKARKDAEKAGAANEREERQKAAAIHGARQFSRGSHAEVAAALFGHLTMTHGAKPAYDESEVWVYNKDGIWRTISEGKLSGLVQSWDGIATVGAECKPWSCNNVDTPIKMTIGKCDAEHQGPGFFAGNDIGIAFADCYVTVDGGVVVQDMNKPENRCRFGFGFALEGANFIGSRFEAYLATLTQDQTIIALLGEFVGLTLLGLAPKFGKALLLYGPGGGGKSTFIHIISQMFPPGTVNSIQPQRWAHGPSLASMAGTRLNAVNEMNTEDLASLGTFKAMVSGDLMEAEPKYKPTFSFRPKTGHLFTANPGQLPTVPDADEPFWQRWICVPFDRVFRGTRDENRQMVEDILATELPVIVSWALYHAQQAITRGSYSVCHAGDVVVAEWRGGVNPVAQFLSECTLTWDGGGRNNALPRLQEVYEAYTQWCVKAGHRPSSRTQLGKRLKAMGMMERSDGSRVKVRILKPFEMNDDDGPI
jgi:P4 family phage/plasmid primase-like protien